MKIALITEFSEIGGGESNLFALAIKLSFSCHVTVFCPRGKLFDLFSQANIDVIELKMFLHRHWYKFMPVTCFNNKLRQTLNEFDLVHVYSVHSLPMVFGIKRPTVWTTHGYWEKPFGLRARVINCYVDKIIAVSKDVYDTADFSERKKELIHLGTSFQHNSETVAEKIFSASEVTISAIGRFQRIKGQDLLLDALFELSKNRRTRFVVFIVGDVNGYYKQDRAYKDELISKVDAYRNEYLDIRLEGFQKNVAEYMLRSDFIVIPSRYESFSMVAIEALSLGKPIIAPDIGGPKDIVDNSGIGILFEAGNVDSLRQSIISMIDNYRNYNKQSCVERSNSFSVDIQAEKHLSLYSDIISRSQLPKILFISVRADCGGSLNHLMQLITNLRDVLKIVVACPKDKPYYDIFNSLVECIEIPHRKFSLFKLFALCWLVKVQNIDIIHSHGKGAGIYSRLLGMITRKPVVHTFHGFHYQHLSAIKQRAYLIIEGLLSLFTSRFINVSLSEKKSCLEAGIISDPKSVIVHNGVQIPAFKKKVLNPTTVKLISVTRLSPEKGVDILIDVIHLLASKFTGFKLIVVGDGPERISLLNKTTKLGISSYIDFLGYREDIPLLLDSADIFITTSKGEGLPISVLEAMAHSLPVIASDVTGNCDLIINNNTGFLFDLNNPAEAVNIILDLISGKRNYELVSNNGYQNVSSNFTVNSMCNSTLAVYRQILHI